MIRWYDYIVAIVFADIGLSLFLTGATNVTGVWWVPVVFGFLAGLIYRLWIDFYCKLRRKQEHGK